MLQARETPPDWAVPHQQASSPRRLLNRWQSEWKRALCSLQRCLYSAAVEWSGQRVKYYLNVEMYSKVKTGLLLLQL